MRYNFPVLDWTKNQCLCSACACEQVMDTNASSCLSCPQWLPSNPWWIYILVDATIYLSMWGLLALGYAVRWRWRGGRQRNALHTSCLRVSCYLTSLLKKAADIFARETRVVVAVEVFYTVLNLVYVCLYVVRSYFGIATQLSVLLSWYLALEACLCTLLVVPLLLRLVHSKNTYKALLYPTTIADALTLPHPFVSLAIGCDWLGLRAARFGTIINVRNLLMHLQIIRSFLTRAVVEFLLRLAAMLLVAAGIIHLLETSGDPWDAPNSGRSCFVVSKVTLMWPDYVYFGITTLTTVGYGDITPKTTLGKVYVMLFMLGGLSLVALAVGPVKDLLLPEERYLSRHFPDIRGQHIVVCGSLSARRMTRLLQDLLHPDRVSVLDRPDLVFLSEQFPTADMKRAVQSHFPHARLLVGSPLKRKDLQRVHLKEAGACIILADMTATEEESADGSAVMRCIAVKNFTKDVRVIMQVLKSETADQLCALPCWNRDKDTVVCTSEWRLGWLASACSCPGLSTILGNLLYPTAHSGKKDSKEVMDLYSGGASLKVYSIHLPLSLVGKSPTEVLFVCQQLGVLVIAVELEHQIHINPTHLSSLGSVSATYVLARECSALHALSTLPETRVQDILNGFESTVWLEEMGSDATDSRGDLVSDVTASAPPDQTELENHYVLCLLTNKASPEVDLELFTSLLLNHDPGSHLVVVAKDTYIQKLMDAGQTKKRHNDAVHFVAGSPLDRSTLLRARVEHCRCCALFTVNPSPDTNEPALWDKDAILCLRVLEGIEHSSGGPIPVVVELLEESNVQFVSLEEDEEEEAEELHLSLPYAFGQVTAMGMLDVVQSASYFDAAGTSIAESILKSVCVKLVAASDLPHHMTTFGQAFIHFLVKGRLCVAVKRLKTSSSMQRYFPILAPRPQLVLERGSDLLFVMT